MNRHLLASGAALIILAGCGSSSPSASPAAPAPAVATATATTSVPTASTPAETDTPTPTPTKEATAAELAKDLQAEVTSITKVVPITEDNDPNNLIGRPNGYVSAAVIYDKGATCSGGLGADCGASIEVWATPAAAKARSEYILGLMKAAPMLGTEYHIVQGSALLRVAGDIKPSEEKRYAAAFKR